MSSSKRSTLTTAVRAALVAAAASTAAPALAGDHEIYSNGNLSLSANFWAAIYAVHTTDTAFGAGGGWTGDGSAPKQDVTNFEYVAMPGLTMSWDQGDAGEIYAGFSFAAAGNAGDGDPSGFTVDGESVVRVNEGYVGWRGDVLDFSVGRQAYSIGTQFLIGGQTEFASPRNPFYWLLPFTAYENTAIMRFSPEGPVTGELFWLRFDPRTQGDTQLAGLTPDAEGLQPAGSDLRIDFGRAQEGVIAAVTRLLGEGPASTTRNGECGAGLVTAVRWSNGLTLNFLEGDFRGWVVDAPGQPVAGGLAVGSLPENVTLEETTLGQEFQSDGVFGLVQTGATIDTLWAGTTCFFR